MCFNPTYEVTRRGIFKSEVGWAALRVAGRHFGDHCSSNRRSLSSCRNVRVRWKVEVESSGFKNKMRFLVVMMVVQEREL